MRAPYGVRSWDEIDLEYGLPLVKQVYTHVRMSWYEWEPPIGYAIKMNTLLCLTLYRLDLYEWKD